MKIAVMQLALAAAFAVAMDPVLCASQQPVPSAKKSGVKSVSRFGRITGLVVDSLHGATLADAEVLAEGKTVAIARTDSTGAFTLKDLQPGNYRLSVAHPLLDSVAISLITPDFQVLRDSVTFVRLAVPSAAALIALKCAKTSRRADGSAVIGRIVWADSLRPISKVEVTVSWTEYSVSKVGGVERTPHVERDTTGSTGAYKICALPNGLQAYLGARVGGDLKSVSRVTVPDSGVTLVVRNLVLPESLRSLAGSSTFVRGRVELANGQPARGTSVEVSGTELKTNADERGNFVLERVPVGTQTVRTRQLGYQEESVVLDVEPFVAQDVVIKLKETVPILATVSVTVTQREQTLDHLGFTQRSKHSVGHFLTADQIAGKSDFRFTDLLRGIPGLQVGIDKYGDDVVASPRAGGSLLNETHGCVQYFVDGIPWGNAALETMGTGRSGQDSTIGKMRARIAIETARQINASLPKSDIIGIEVYQGGGAPAYFNQGGHNCATIVVWTTASLGG